MDENLRECLKQLDRLYYLQILLKRAETPERKLELLERFEFQLNTIKQMEERLYCEKV